MAESNATQVILTDDGIKIINAQNTADNAAGGVTNLNDPNLMSVIEKQTQASQYAGLTSQYNVVLARAKDANVSTTALTTAYTNLNTFMTAILTDTTKASDVDRDTYKSLTDTYNSALSKVQKNLDDYVNNEFSTASSQAVVADSNATAAKEAADSTYAYANSEIAVQSNATQNAQNKADSAFNQAQTAIDNNQTTNADITKLRNGSTMTIADLENGLATKVANSDYASYKAQTASQIAQKVDNGAFSAYQTTTADLIAQKVATSDFSSYQATTAKEISSKVESSDFQTYQTQTDKMISSKVSTADYDEQIMLINNNINLKVAKGDLIDEINLQAGNTLISSSGQLTLSADTIFFDTKKPVIIPSANIDSLLVGKKLTAADIAANTFSTNNGTFTVDSNGNVVASNLTIRGVTNLVYNAALLGGNGSSIPGWGLNGEPYYSNATLFDGLPAIVWNGDAAGRWDNYANSKFQPVTQTGIPYSASIKFRDYGSASGMLYTFTLGFFSDYDANTRVGYLQQVYTANGSDSGIQTFTINNAIAPSNTKYVAIQLYAYNGKGHAAFSSPMLTQTAQSTGYQPDTGNVISAGEIDGSVINGSTINGGTLNMQTDGLINSPYTGIEQSADQYYHPWKLNTGQLTIGQGYITSVSSGTRSINGVPKQFNSLQGTLSASYLKFTNDYGARTYIDADMFTYSNQTNDTAMVAISASGVGINMGTMSAPALTISNGYIDASSSSSYGVFGAITLGYNAHTINSDSSLFFESGYGSGNPGINIWAKGFQSLSSRLSTKRQVKLLDDEHSNSLLLGADTATFQYNQDTNADNSNEGVIIDDVNTAKQYNLPDELITRDGKAPTDLMSFIARVISQNKYQARLIEDLQIRLRKVEIKNE
ncbi:phage tail protein [Lactiplantibacillus plantarum]|uniref:phage tail protein n=1 Tax=Lactiplantibacillus plantarum TaxID=1590 RepID=UPI003B50BD72